MTDGNTLEHSRVWFVTGATSGFGRALSEAVLEHGDQLVATGRDPHTLHPLTDQHPDHALPLQLDVTNPDAARTAITHAVSHFGRLDVVVNNAGYAHTGAIEELTDTELRQQLNVNLLGVINITRAALPTMRNQRSGHLVQMSSLNGIEGLAGAGYYATSKFAVEGFSESLAHEVAHLGIHVTIIEPGPHRTHFLSTNSAKWANPMPDYAHSAGHTRQILSHLHGNQPGDPTRAAQAIIHAIDTNHPPLRLPLGQLALNNIRTKLTTQLTELDTWAHLSTTSDYPNRT